MTEEALILNNLGLVRGCANKFRGKGIEYEELYSAGCMGLVKAAKGFDESLGFAFSTYAVPTVLGEIKRLFRDNGAVKVSRSIKEKVRELNRQKERLEREKGVEPTVSELAEALNLTVFETAELIGAAAPPLSLTDPENEKQLDIPAGDEYSSIDDKISVRDAIKALPPEDKKLVALRFYGGLTQSDAARELGISQVQVSRREKKILSFLRQKLA